jgi:alkylation response protein AidB-like acyl-CoA dehydrogenase
MSCEYYTRRILMNYFLTPEQLKIKEEAREIAQNIIAPQVSELDAKGEFPWDILKVLAKNGFLGLFVPAEYGGSGGGVLELSIAVEEISRICAGVATSYAANALATFPILLFGNEEQKIKYLTPVAKGEKMAAFALTEPNAGSDAGGIQTTAKKDGDCYILNGSKQWITNGGEAEVYTVFAMTDKNKGARGISAFIVEKNYPGFSFGKKEDKLGIRCSATRELAFTDCRVPAKNLLGREGLGFMVAMKTLDKARPGVGAEAVGIAQGALDMALDFVAKRQKEEREFVSWQRVQARLANMATYVEAARSLVYCTAKMIDAGEKSFSMESAMSKLFSTDVAMKVSYEAMELLAEEGVERHLGLENP